MARELHDDLNQRMAMLANEVSTLEQTPPGSAGLLRKQLRSLCERVNQLSDDLRNAAHRLHPSALEHFGVAAAIESHCSEFAKLHRIRSSLRTVACRNPFRWRSRLPLSGHAGMPEQRCEAFRSQEAVVTIKKREGDISYRSPTTERGSIPAWWRTKTALASLVFKNGYGL